MKLIKYIFIANILMTSCSKDEEEGGLEPVLTYDSMTPTELTELVDEITIKFNYSDADGDLGESDDATAINLFITDSRNQVVNSFRVKQLAPDNATIAIEGTLSVIIPPLVITDGSASEIGAFSIYMVDRAGNKSNVIVSEQFTVKQL